MFIGFKIPRSYLPILLACVAAYYLLALLFVADAVLFACVMDVGRGDEGGANRGCQSIFPLIPCKFTLCCDSF